MTAHESLTTLTDLTGRVAVVTGAAAGIGRACAVRLREAGASVVAVDRDGDAWRDLGASQPDHMHLVTADVTAAGAAAAIVDQALARFGRVDILVNNAGIYPLERLLDLTEETLDRAYDLNVKANLLLARAAASAMIEQGTGGRIVNIASIEAYHPASVGFIGYAATKGAVVTFTKHAALELAPHAITVNAVAPGPVRTEGVASLGADGSVGADAGQELVRGFVSRIPLGRLAEPDDVALAVLFFAGGLASYVTGETLLVDGGNILS